MWAMAMKEFRQMRRDRRTLAMMILLPVPLQEAGQRPLTPTTRAAVARLAAWLDSGWLHPPR